MTALKEFERLEATGLWRATPEEQRREVVVSIGDATLTISNFNNQALTHWSLAALDRHNPGEWPAIYGPDGDPGETLELAESETMMVDAIERLRQAIERSRPRPGRLRLAGVVLTLVALAALLVFWLPDAMLRHTLSVVPEIKREAIGEALLGRVERVSGRACRTADTTPVLNRLAKRTGVRKLVVLQGGVRDSLLLPGGIVLLNKALIEDHEDPAVAAGYILAERARAARMNPLQELLAEAGPTASFRLLTTGEVNQASLDHYAERVMLADRPAVPDRLLLEEFARVQVPSTPYAYARDITGESVLGLIEADPMAGKPQNPVMRDRDWVLLQNICGG
ncbi:hypothetical protein ACXYMO_17725 [Arenibacterium sp. CAU 1754]